MSRCQRKIVPGVTISRITARRPMGSVPANSALRAGLAELQQITGLVQQGPDERGLQVPPGSP